MMVLSVAQPTGTLNSRGGAVRVLSGLTAPGHGAVITDSTIAFVGVSPTKGAPSICISPTQPSKRSPTSRASAWSGAP
eukprot:8606852-Alexandrium_andersonii.AAC.1